MRIKTITNKNLLSKKVLANVISQITTWYESAQKNIKIVISQSSVNVEAIKDICLSILKVWSIKHNIAIKFDSSNKYDGVESKYYVYNKSLDSFANDIHWSNQEKGRIFKRSELTKDNDEGLTDFALRWVNDQGAETVCINIIGKIESLEAN